MKSLWERASLVILVSKNDLRMTRKLCFTFKYFFQDIYLDDVLCYELSPKGRGRDTLERKIAQFLWQKKFLSWLISRFPQQIIHKFLLHLLISVANRI